MKDSSNVYSLPHPHLSRMEEDNVFRVMICVIVFGGYVFICFNYCFYQKSLLSFISFLLPCECFLPVSTEMVKRDTPGYAIGGLSGGEEKDQFWRIVSLCTDLLPKAKPRYSMGVG